MGMPIAIQCTNGTRTPPNFSMKPSPRMFTELPAGVPMPPMSDAIGMPSITERANDDCPGTSPILSNSPSATAMNTAAHGTSDTTVDSVAVPTMKSSSARRVEPPALASSQHAKRCASPVLVNAWAMTNITSTKKNTGLMKLVNAAPSGASPSSGCSTRVRSAVMAIGIASVTHSSSATAKSAPARWPSGGRSAGVGSAHSTAPRTMAATIAELCARGRHRSSPTLDARARCVNPAR